MGNKHSKIKTLHAKVQVRDKIIGGLLHEITRANIKLPDYLLNAINLLYYKKHKKENVTNAEEEKAGKKST